MLLFMNITIYVYTYILKKNNIHMIRVITLTIKRIIMIMTNYKNDKKVITTIIKIVLIIKTIKTTKIITTTKKLQTFQFFAPHVTLAYPSFVSISCALQLHF